MHDLWNHVDGVQPLARLEPLRGLRPRNDPGGAGLLAECIYFGATILAGGLTRHGGGGVLVPMIAFSVGYAVGGALVGRSKHPLDVARWRAFATGLAVVVAVGVLGTIAVGPLAVVASLPVGLAVGLMVVATGDADRKARLSAEFHAFHAARAATAATPFAPAPVPPRSPVIVRAPNGRDYSGIALGWASGQVHVVFPDGSAIWVPEMSVPRVTPGLAGTGTLAGLAPLALGVPGRRGSVPRTARRAGRMQRGRSRGSCPRCVAGWRGCAGGCR